MTIRKHLGRDKIQYIMEPKVDGVSISVHYRHGKLALGVTRGDGTEGDDITTNLKTVRAIPLEFVSKNCLKKGAACLLLEVRGEAYMAIKDFEALNRKLAAAGEKPFPTPATPPPARSNNSTHGSSRSAPFAPCFTPPARWTASSSKNIPKCSKPSPIRPAHAKTLVGLRWHRGGFKIYREKVVAHYDEDKDLRRQVAVRD
jgi:hypothetical protein